MMYVWIIFKCLLLLCWFVITIGSACIRNAFIVYLFDGNLLNKNFK